HITKNLNLVDRDRAHVAMISSQGVFTCFSLMRRKYPSELALLQPFTLGAWLVICITMGTLLWFTIFMGPRLQQCRFDLFVFSLLSPRPTPDTSQIPSLSMTALACLMLLFPQVFILNVYKNEVTAY